jgi:hypothetical protein
MLAALTTCGFVLARICALVVVCAQELLEGDTQTAVELVRGVG